jgi:hypothetical protein
MAVMDINRILAELQSERHHIEQAIVALQYVGGKKRRGRPPKWMSQAGNEKPAPSERKKRRSEPVQSTH